MTPINEIKPEEIRGVLYLDSGTPGRVNTVKLIMEDGHTHVYSGEDLASALAVAKERFRPEPEETRMADERVRE